MTINLDLEVIANFPNLKELECYCRNITSFKSLAKAFKNNIKRDEDVFITDLRLPTKNMIKQVNNILFCEPIEDEVEDAVVASLSHEDKARYEE